MPDAFIVTIIDLKGHFETDLEIPSQLPFASFKAKLLEILKIMDGQIFGGWKDYRLYFNNGIFSNGDTLASVGAFDGSKLIVEQVRL